jgi:UDP-glucose 4-epimerase
MKILLVGGTGFIGSNLSRYLVEQGHKVRVLTRKLTVFSYVSPLIEYVYGDFLDEAALDACLEDIDIVVQLVSSTVPSTSNLDMSYDVQSNIGGMLQLLNACVKNSVQKVIFPSSGGTIYGMPKQIPINESHPTDPICSYGITKLAIEKYLYLFNYLNELDYVILRISNPYGAGQSPNGKVGVIPTLLYKIMHQETIKIWGDGGATRDYIYIHDVIAAFGKVIDSSTEHRLFNIGSGQGVSLNQLIDIIQQIFKIDINVEYGESRSFDIPVNVLDISRAKTHLDWTPQTSLEEGILLTWKWLHSMSA